MEQDHQDGTMIPGYLAELGQRVERVTERIGSRIDAAKAAGISISQLNRYISGQNQPTFASMISLAMAADVNLDWLATGNGPMCGDKTDETVSTPAASPTPSGASDVDLYGRVLEEISNVYKEFGWHKSLRDLGTEAARIAGDLAADGLAPDDKPGAIKGMGIMLRHQLRDALAHPQADGSTKSRA